MANRPNILIFMTDQQCGETVLSGSRMKAKTPHLDRFREEAVTFSEVHCPAPHCCPSRATFFSGLYPSGHGVWHNVNVGNAISRGLFDGIRLWSEDLASSGYTLDFSGKWHVSDLERPSDRGWREHFATAASQDGRSLNRPSLYEWDRYTPDQTVPSGERTRQRGEILRPGYLRYVHYGERDNPFRDGDVTAEGIRILRERPKSDAPWCQFIGTLGPHDPYFAPQEFIDLYEIDDIQLPETFHDTMEDKPAFYRRTREIFAQLTEEEHREAILHYLALCSYEDHLFGQVLEALEERGEVENTVVIFMSDHGDYVGEHGLWCKGLPAFRQAYHVPAIVRWPAGLADPGRTVEEFVSLADFAPTFLDLAACEYRPTRMPAARSLMPFLRGQDPPAWRDAIFCQSNGNELYGIQRGIRTRDWRYVFNGFDYDELYDLRNDPGEMHNLARDPEHAGTIRELAARIWQFGHENSDACVNSYIMVGFAPVGPGIIFEK